MRWRNDCGWRRVYTPNIQAWRRIHRRVHQRPIWEWVRVFRRRCHYIRQPRLQLDIPADWPCPWRCCIRIISEYPKSRNLSTATSAWSPWRYCRRRRRSSCCPTSISTSSSTTPTSGPADPAGATRSGTISRSTIASSSPAGVPTARAITGRYTRRIWKTFGGVTSAGAKLSVRCADTWAWRWTRNRTVPVRRPCPPLRHPRRPSVPRWPRNRYPRYGRIITIINSNNSNSSNRTPFRASLFDNRPSSRGSGSSTWRLCWRQTISIKSKLTCWGRSSRASSVAARTSCRRPIKTTKTSTSTWWPMQTPYRHPAHRRRPARMCPRSCHRHIGTVRVYRAAVSSSSNNNCQLYIFTIIYTSEITTSRLTPPAGPASNGEFRRSRSIRAAGSCSYLKCIHASSLVSYPFRIVSRTLNICVPLL